MTAVFFGFQATRELATSMVMEYNEFIHLVEGYDFVSADEVLPILQDVFDPEELKFLIETDYGRAFVMGQVSTRIELHNAEANDAAAEEAT